ncbi:hypothetical protein P7K49_020098 [Saguinus oedipus]|uniref:Golgin subfamily A conserved domain-containing protein n=1 Tax=Saguinus oedipus TaxID=9490 RepID=A0ABQ9UZB0_SAGOE|nr:hypothetical protein P7K49_020098 [Saguinus oedipus]
MLSQNRELKEQLVKLQSRFTKLPNKNMEITSALQSEQQGLSVDGAEEPRGSEFAVAEDQYLGHLQQYVVACQQQVATYQQLTSEKEGLYNQLLLQTQLMDHLQLQAQSKAVAKIAYQELRKTQVAFFCSAVASAEEKQALLGEYIALYQSQRAVLKEQHWEKECISRLIQDKEMKVKLLELVLQFVGYCNEWSGRFLAAAQNPADEPAPGAPAPQELRAANKQSGVPCQQHGACTRRGGEGSPCDSLTAQQIMQLLCEMQNPQECPGLGSSHCIPLLYWTDENDEVRITVI